MTKNPLNILITTKVTYLPEESSPAHHRFMWSYEVTIKNDSDQIVQLLNRHWRITDMTSKVEEVRGPGVVGLQPVIKPGKQFVYSSFCQLPTPQGTMGGSYEMQNIADEVRFLQEIPKLVLTCPTTQTEKYRSRLH